ncbi:MAG TPA: aldehyde-activating protein [Alphaproteobacteria bacterium]|nr:aldehyde-activating protein [Alphaproteobacteria bacterium]
MSEIIKAKASCLCGSVKFTVDQMSTSLSSCHCGMCQKWTGGPYLAVEVSGDINFIAGKELVSAYNSSDWANRNFCSKCGSNLYCTLKNEGRYYMPIGIFEGYDKNSIHFDTQIFIDKKPPFYDFSNKTENYTEDQIMAQYAEYFEKQASLKK